MAGPGAHVSTGRLPGPRIIRRALTEAFEAFGGRTDGRVSSVYPALAAVDPERFGICLVGATTFLAGRLGLDLLASRPLRSGAAST